MSTSVQLDSLDTTWQSWDGMHGGYLAGLLVSHAREQLPGVASGAAARALHVNLLTAVRGGRIDLRGEVLRATRNTTTVRVTLAAAGQDAVTGIATFGQAGEGAATDRPGETAPDVAPAPDCPVLPVDDLVPFARNVEIRPADGRAPLLGGPEPELTAWLRLRTPPADPAQAAVVLVDTLAPGLYGVLREPVPIPTVELAAHFTESLRGFEPGDWVLGRIRTEHAAAGWCVDDCTLWNVTGTMLATGRQTRRVLLS
ncbi:Acyl-CoA thioesterase [Haloechinothrix alba]|uniref:Acyl-CoA thioesterase n=1 Tax=Haloechinothrix alba TaxID=664784 RepID=A0A238Z3R3_9PSEU|nr:thioesterase family protein [Haloechinothrix alba]SNR77549.1 Acyl-CoA thioesterase [Haloechinothrix alba]